MPDNNTTGGTSLPSYDWTRGVTMTTRGGQPLVQNSDGQPIMTTRHTTSTGQRGTAEQIVDASILRNTSFTQMLEDYRLRTYEPFYEEFRDSVAVPKTNKSNPDEQFMRGIKARLNGGEEVTKDEMRKYLLLLKKKRHIGRDERTFFHKPKDDSGKTTASYSVDDLVNI